MKACSRVEALVVMLAAGLSACGPPKLSHFDGRPFALRGPIEMLSDGWLAVDSRARGRHVLLEIEIDTIDVKASGAHPLSETPQLVSQGLRYRHN